MGEGSQGEPRVVSLKEGKNLHAKVKWVVINCMLKHERGILHGRHQRRIFTGVVVSHHRTVETEAAIEAAIDYVYQLRRHGQLLNPKEALMLAGTMTRGHETLYSIAMKFSNADEIDMNDVLNELQHRFPDYA